MPPLRVVAAALQHGLHYRYLDPTDVVAWADREIASTANSPTWVLELSLPGRNPHDSLSQILQSSKPATAQEALPHILGTILWRVKLGMLAPYAAAAVLQDMHFHGILAHNPTWEPVRWLCYEFNDLDRSVYRTAEEAAEAVIALLDENSLVADSVL